MATLTGFTTAYTGGPSFYTGSGTSTLVPDVFPVAIAGRPYMLDVKSGRFGRAFENRTRDSQDGGNIPGESTLNSGGLWRRGQTSWHKGAGQQYADVAEGVDTRFYDSRHIDPWTKGEIKLLPTVKTASAHTGSNTDNIYLAVADSQLFWSVNQTVYYTADPYASTPSVSTVASTPASKIRAMATDGTNIYASFPGTTSSYGVRKIDSATHTSSTLCYGNEFGAIGYAKGHICIGGAGSDSKYLWFDPSGSNPTPSFTHPNSAWTWVGFASGQNAIYAAGYAGKVSLIYKITIKNDGTLETPVVAAELPSGEIVSTIYGYLGYLLIGSNYGVRFANADNNSNLVLGPVLRSGTSNPVYQFDAEGRYVWGTWTNVDSEHTGLGRMDLAEFTGTNAPAYACDLLYAGQGIVTGVATLSAKRVFAVSGVGVLVEDSANLAPSGWIETGTWRWGISEPKIGVFADFTSQPMNGTVTMAINADGAGYETLPAFSAQGSTAQTWETPDTPFAEAKIKLTFTRDATDSSTGPTLTRWQIRAFAAPPVSELFSVPVLLHSKINRFNREYYLDVTSELGFLRDLKRDTRVVSYQEGEEIFKVVVENVEWVPIDIGNKSWEYHGTAIVTMRSLTA